MEPKSIVFAMFVEAGDGIVFNYTLNLYGYEGMDMQGNDSMAGFCFWHIVKTVLFMVRNEGHGAFIGFHASALSVLHHGIWFIVLEF